MPEALKPCPCGRKDVGTRYDLKAWLCFVQCFCGFSGSKRMNRKLAIAAWNRRVGDGETDNK